jgi:hypothetical protein
VPPRSDVVLSDPFRELATGDRDGSCIGRFVRVAADARTRFHADCAAVRLTVGRVKAVLAWNGPTYFTGTRTIYSIAANREVRHE